MLEHYYHNEWVHLVALEPDEGIFIAIDRRANGLEWAMKSAADSGAIMRQLTE